MSATQQDPEIERMALFQRWIPIGAAIIAAPLLIVFFWLGGKDSQWVDFLLLGLIVISIVVTVSLIIGAVLNGRYAWRKEKERQALEDQ